MDENQSASEFYLVVTPGLEDLARLELLDWLPGTVITASRGGLAVSLPLTMGLELNRVLKIPTRILLRVADFGCRDFPKLYKKLLNFQWGNWISDAQPVEFEASTTRSRLRIKKRIEETCRDGLKAHRKKKGITVTATDDRPADPLSVFVRFDDDVCTISFDTSGEILHKRGLRPLSAHAPLRETMAAALLRYIESFASDTERGSKVELVDPMTGGGTFLLEAAMMRKPVESRRFSFESWLVADAKREHRTLSADPYGSFVGYESDVSTASAAKENLSSVGRSGNLALHQHDFFDAEALPPGPRRWLVANPPYGERLRVEGKLSDFYERLFAKSETVARPELALFLLPEKVSPRKLRLPREWRFRGELKFLNGGLPVVAIVFGRQENA